MAARVVTVNTLSDVISNLHSSRLIQTAPPSFDLDLDCNWLKQFLHFHNVEHVHCCANEPNTAENVSRSVCLQHENKWLIHIS